MADEIDIRVPAVSPHGPVVLARWLVADQSTVLDGTVICELDMEKATIEMEVFATGTLIQLAGTGATFWPDDLIARIILP